MDQAYFTQTPALKNDVGDNLAPFVHVDCQCRVEDCPA